MHCKPLSATGRCGMPRLNGRVPTQCQATAVPVAPTGVYHAPACRSPSNGPLLEGRFCMHCTSAVPWFAIMPNMALSPHTPSLHGGEQDSHISLCPDVLCTCEDVAVSCLHFAALECIAMQYKRGSAMPLGRGGLCGADACIGGSAPSFGYG
jgi:hypothetical protein